MENKKKMIPGLILMFAVSIALYYGMLALEPKLLASPKLFGYVDWALSVPGSFLYKIFWIFGDLTEAVAYKSLIASLLFIVGCFVAHWLCRNKPSLKIYPITLGLGVLPWVILGALVGVATSVFVYSFMFTYSPMWIPTFLPGCTVPAALIAMYGGGLRTTLTSGVLSGLIQFPFAFAGFILAQKAGVPPLVFLTLLGICVAGILVVEIFRILPWTRGLATGKEPPKMAPYKDKAPVLPEPKLGFMVRRTITDLTELSFVGSDVAAVFLLAGAFISWFLNPAHLCSGIPFLFPAILCSQLLTGALCVFFFYDKWVERGFFPSFTAVIGSAVCVMQFGTSLPVILLVTVLNTAITAPLSCMGFFWTAKHIKRYPVLCGTVVTMGVGIGICAIITRLILATGILG